MDQADIVILEVKPMDIPRLEIKTSNGKSYFADLAQFQDVDSFPKTSDAWQRVSITASGFNVTWESGFEVHVDQIIDRAIKETGT